jgi:peptide/nickel transport system permease protein
VLCCLIVLLAFVGPYFAPSSPTEVVGLPFQPPTASHWLGVDTLGRDVFSRFLLGGRTIITVAIVATVIAYAIGISVGMAAGFLRGAVDWVTIGVVDTALAFPPIIIILALLAAAGPSLGIVILSITVVHVPRVVRIVRAVTMEVAASEFVEAAVARGESARSIIFREIMPNIWTPTLADFGLRVTGSIILFASLAYLGLAARPPTPDWGYMINENRNGLMVNPWAIVVPAIAIAALCVGVNLIADAIARSVGRSIDNPDV